MNLENNKLYVNTHILFEQLCECVEDGVFIDAGANIGGMFCVAKELEIHAFEPVPDCFEKLTELFGNRPKTYLNKLGLSDRKGRLKDVTVLGTWTIGNPIELQMDVALDYKGKQFDVDLVTLDDYVFQKIITVGAMKIDVDGYELKVLLGGEKTIMRDRPPICIELSGLPIKLGASITNFVNYVIGTLGYVFVSNDGRFMTSDSRIVLENWPFHTSFDATLLPAEHAESMTRIFRK